MRSRLVLASLVVIGGITVFAGTLLATPPSKVTPAEYGVGKFDSFATTGRIGAWAAAMNVKGASDLHVLSNNRARRVVWVAQSSRAELRDRQVGDGDRLSGR
jgi:hypothetical protein